MHIVQNMPHQGVDQSPACILGISSNAGDSAHIHDLIMNIHLHGIDYDHGRQLFPVKPSKHIGFFQNGPFGILDLVLLPACL